MEQHERDVRRVIAGLGRLPTARPRPAFVVLGGLPASGKSTVAYEISTRAEVAWLQSDRIRKLLTGIPQYTVGESARIFGVMHAAAERLLAAGVPVIFDATTLTEDERQPLREIAGRTGARLLVVWVQAPEAVIRQRMAARRRGAQATYDRSDADMAVYGMMRARVEPIKGEYLRIDTGGSDHTTIDALVQAVAPAETDQ